MMVSGSVIGMGIKQCFGGDYRAGWQGYPANQRNSSYSSCPLGACNWIMWKDKRKWKDVEQVRHDLIDRGVNGVGIGKSRDKEEINWAVVGVSGCTHPPGSDHRDSPMGGKVL